MVGHDELPPPDLPRSELERAIDELIDRAGVVLRTQGRLRTLLGITRAVVERLQLPDVLRRIVEGAIALVDAEYGALGVIGPDGHLEQFIHVGMPDDAAERIGHLPRGEGLLGAVIERAAPIRLDDLTRDPRSIGFPPEHPPMGAFLGVPIRVGVEVFGNLYLTNSRRGVFGGEDEELVLALAATAGIAIENARLFEDAERRQQWTAAKAAVTAVLLTGDAEDALEIVVDKVSDLVGAALVCVVVPVAGSGDLRVAAARGHGADRLRGVVVDAGGSCAQRAMATGRAMTRDAGPLESESGATGPTAAVPLPREGGMIGAITIERAPGTSPFSGAEMSLVSEFAEQAAISIEVARGRADRRRLELAEDRGRIARDLHDHVIQRLFGSGLVLQAQAATVAEPARSALIGEVESLDQAIRDIRTAVFTLTPVRHGPEPLLRARLLDVISPLTSLLPSSPTFSSSGPVDHLVTGALADDVVAVVRESLTNVVRHAAAQTCSVDVSIVDDQLRIRVEDDGRGVTDSPHRGGTANLAERAVARGGHYLLDGREGGGSRVLWDVPLSGEDP